jgi:tetratricopeptide (TPR) repeat protein
MKPSEELFDLIKSLTKSEKRFFKLSSSLQSGSKNYLKIFAAIDKQNEYDEESIKNEFKKETFVKHFPSEKNHLYKLILKSLRAYHADNSVSSILKQEIKNIEILYTKSLYQECNKFLGRAKKMAITHEKFYYLYELLSWEKILLEEAYEEGEFTMDLDKLIDEERNVIEKLRNLAAYHVLHSKINYVFRSGGYARSERDNQIIEEISNHPLIINKNTALSSRAATICYYIQGFCAMAKRDWTTSREKFGKVKDIFDKNELIKKDIPKRYIRTLSNIIKCETEQGKYEEVHRLLAEMKELEGKKGFKTLDIEVLIFKASSLAELKLSQRQGRFQESVDKVELLLERVEEYSSRINKEQEIRFYYNFAYMYFGVGEYNKALFWINKVLNDNETNLRQDIYGYARLFNLVIHYELGNKELLEYIIKSTHRYLNKRNRAYEIESLIITNLKKLTKVYDKAEEKKLMEKMLPQFLKVIENDDDSVILEYFDYEAWMRSKIDEVSFEEAVKQGAGMLAKA